MCPLARQGDFYVPEVKEAERKSRGLAEAGDTQMDGTGMEGRGMRWALSMGMQSMVEEPPPWLGCPVGVPG